MTSMFVFLAFLGLHSGFKHMCEASDLPGLKIRLSTKGLDYVSNAALDVMTSRLSGQSIDDYHGQSGKTKFDITRVRITSFNKPHSETTVAPGSGITWKLSGGSVSIKGDWHYKYRQNWLQIGMDNSGQPTIHTTGCSSEVGSADVHLHGGGSWFYNIFDSAIERNVKRNLKNKLCDAAKLSIDKEGVKRMKSLNLQVYFSANRLMLDYRLVAPPKFTTNYLESFHKGEVFLKGDSREAPFQPFPLSGDEPSESHMMTFWASDYILNTLGYLLQHYGLVHHTLTNKDVSKQFPNSSVIVHMVSTQGDFPRFTMLAGELRGHISGMAFFSVRTPNGSHVHMFRAHVEPELDAFFKLIADTWIIPKLDELGDIGFELPIFNDFHFVNPEIKIQKGAMQLLVDFKYL
ncbi:hypothetical protein NP493_1915g00000 [Ridgeia piscesae]|uniref:Lipid-binding serum glycoprotein N-terminal domain-containing protein n=1 Tax=Ridgeia piscesae TaxID=27915 RepID=A0AAD9JQG3_RIDPI|nr:hypothetical protein NP493_1915g00000 [Ridgeia piscesae]